MSTYVDTSAFTQLASPDPLKNLSRLLGLKIIGVWHRHDGALKLHFDDGTMLVISTPPDSPYYSPLIVTQQASDEL